MPSPSGQRCEPGCWCWYGLAGMHMSARSDASSYTCADTTRLAGNTSPTSADLVPFRSTWTKFDAVIGLLTRSTLHLEDIFRQMRRHRAGRYMIRLRAVPSAQLLSVRTLALVAVRDIDAGLDHINRQPSNQFHRQRSALSLLRQRDE